MKTTSSSTSSELVGTYFRWEFDSVGPFVPWANQTLEQAVRDPLFMMALAGTYALPPLLMRAILSQAGGVEEARRTFFSPGVDLIHRAPAEGPSAGCSVCGGIYGQPIPPDLNDPAFGRLSAVWKMTPSVAVDHARAVASIRAALIGSSSVVRASMTMQRAAGISLRMRFHAAALHAFK